MFADDTSDTEIQLAKMLGAFKRMKIPSTQEVLSLSEPNDTERLVPFETETRLKRSSTENIYLLSSKMTRYLSSHEFEVRGSTGKIYIVKIGPRLECSCHDRMMRSTHCKHILYILVHELKLIDLRNQVFSTLYPSEQVTYTSIVYTPDL
ncbi:hypothetical protein EDC94DRAFT_251597 [Helicostylum pulchrum]|nr:hypothetical protein EDC94DRAFT_251597 [Helicostylum pulchrum]